ncbi:MAG: sulfotransferase [Cyanobacteria bacterium J06621_8]
MSKHNYSNISVANEIVPSGKMPDFLIIGAAKSGTTSLYRYLEEHPQVYMSRVKEPQFFAFEDQQINFQGPGDMERINNCYIPDLESYQTLFHEAQGKIAGEASTWYLYSSKAAKNINKYLPNVKIIAVLRNPVDRAYSSFLHLAGEGSESFNFTQGLKAEQKRIEKNYALLWHYTQAGFYSEQIKRYFQVFTQNQIKIYLYDDLVANPINVIQDVYQFIGVDSKFIPNTHKKYNVSGIPKSKTLDRLLFTSNPIKSLFKPLVSKKIRKKIQQKSKQKPSIPLDIRQELTALYKNDILTLEKLIQKDLSSWL